MHEIEKNPYSRINPYFAKITKRELLSKPGSNKKTHHIVLNIEGSGLDYQVGDSIGIYPKNDPHLVNWTLRALNATGSELVFNKKEEREMSLLTFLEEKANITDVSKKFLMELAKRQKHAEKKAKLEFLLDEVNKEVLKEYLESHELWDTLEENKEADESFFEIQELCDLLMPLLPRYYSISSAKSAVGEEIHLCVALLEYESNQLLRRGVCTHYLCNLAPFHEPVLGIFIHPQQGFTIPEDNEKPIIMVGPGTGIAPFRAFLQERIQNKAKGKNWLFFGEWKRDFDFFYEEYLTDLASQGLLKLDTAFSRDQEEKIYVQHKLFEKGKEIYDWLQEGAYFYVCGDAKKMARDVEAILLQIIEHFGEMDEASAKAYLKELRSEKRYLKDVY